MGTHEYMDVTGMQITLPCDSGMRISEHVLSRHLHFAASDPQMDTQNKLYHARESTRQERAL